MSARKFTPRWFVDGTASRLGPATSRLAQLPRTAYNRWVAFLLRRRGVEVGRDCEFYGVPIVFMERDTRIVLGDRVVIRSDALSNTLTQGQRTVLSTTEPGARLVIENDVGMSATVLRATRSITVGHHTLIGAGALIIDGDSHPKCPACRDEWRFVEGRDVRIGPRSFIGARAIVLKGTVLGEGSVVGAGAVVLGGEIAPDSLIVGNPGKVVGTCTCEEHSVVPAAG